MTKNTYSVVIIDDQAMCIDTLKKSFTRFPEFIIKGIASEASEGKKIIFETKPDLLFLDMELAEQSGLDLLYNIEDQITWNMHVVFYTAYERYLIDALRVSAFDFLLKPYTSTDFIQIVERFKKKSQNIFTPNTLRDNLSKLIPAKRKFMISTVSGFLILQVEQIYYFEYQRSNLKWCLYMNDSKLKPIQLKRGTNSEDILKLSSSFIKISQNNIINIDYLSCINDTKCILLPPYENLRLSITRTYLALLQNRIESI